MSRDLAEDVWMESLLHQLYHDDGDAMEARLQVLRTAIEADGKRVRVPLATPRRWRPFLAYGVAVSLLLIVGFWTAPWWQGVSDRAAMAAVVRSMSVSDGYRQYRVKIVGGRVGPRGGDVEARLYLDPGDRFILVHPGWLGFSQTVVGGDREQRWVAPKVGPVLKGGEGLLGPWLLKRNIASPYLHVPAILERMQRAYRLEMLPEDELMTLDVEGRKTGEGRVCQRVRGKLRDGIAKRWTGVPLPDTVELWADGVTGAACKLEIGWEGETLAGVPRRWTLELLEGDTDAAWHRSEWYEMSTHVVPGRRVMEVGSKRDLDTYQEVERELP